MARTLVGALALAALPTAFSFSNTSPFFLFSTAELLLDNTNAAIADASTVQDNVLAALKDCPTQSYFIVDSPGVISADYADGLSTPQLSNYMNGKHDNVRTTLALPEIIGRFDTESLESRIKDSCAEKFDGKITVKVLKDGVVSSRSDERKMELHAIDSRLDRVFDASKDFTVIYTTSPPANMPKPLVEEPSTYEMEPPFGESVQMELKRDVSSHQKRAATKQGGLFERYQYFTPGIFLGLVAITPLFLILVVGIRALTSLEVSYFAFSKEMGPNAQKKQ